MLILYDIHLYNTNRTSDGHIILHTLINTNRTSDGHIILHTLITQTNRTSDAHIILHTLIQSYCIKKGRNIFACFVDF